MLAKLIQYPFSYVETSKLSSMGKSSICFGVTAKSNTCFTLFMKHKQFSSLLISVDAAVFVWSDESDAGTFIWDGILICFLLLLACYLALAVCYQAKVVL